MQHQTSVRDLNKKHMNNPLGYPTDDEGIPAIGFETSYR